MRPINAAAIFCNVPFRSGIGADALLRALATGDNLDVNLPYLDRLMNEAPIEMLGEILNDFQPEDRPAVLVNFDAIASRVGASSRIKSWMKCG